MKILRKWEHYEMYEAGTLEEDCVFSSGENTIEAVLRGTPMQFTHLCLEPCTLLWVVFRFLLPDRK